MNSFARPFVLAALGLALTAPSAAGQLGLDLSAGPVIPLGKSANQLSTGLHVHVAVPFGWWTLPGVSKIPLPPWPDALDFLRPRLTWRAEFQYEQMAGPSRPVRVMAVSAEATRFLPRKATWFISPYMVGGVGAYNTQSYLANPLANPGGIPAVANASARTNVGFDGGLGLTNQLAGYPVSLEGRYRYIRNALSDGGGKPFPLRALTVTLRYTFPR